MRVAVVSYHDSKAQRATTSFHQVAYKDLRDDIRKRQYMKSREYMQHQWFILPETILWGPVSRQND